MEGMDKKTIGSTDAEMRCFPSETALWPIMQLSVYCACTLLTARSISVSCRLMSKIPPGLCLGM